MCFLKYSMPPLSQATLPIGALHGPIFEDLP